MCAESSARAGDRRPRADVQSMLMLLLRES